MKGFYARVIEEKGKKKYVYALDSKNLSFEQLSCLLACLKTIEANLLEHIDAIQPDMEIKEDDDKE